MYKLLRRIKIFFSILCVLTALAISFEMPDLIFAYENKSLSGRTERIQIKEADLNLYSELDYFQKISLLNNSKSIVQLKSGAFLQRNDVLKKLYEGLDTILGGTHAFTEKKPSAFEWTTKECTPWICSNASTGKSFIMWQILVYGDAGTVNASMDDETGIILFMGYSVYKFDSEFDGDTTISSDDNENYGDLTIIDTEELAKRYIEYTSEAMPEIMKEEKYFAFNYGDTEYDEYGEIIKDSQNETLYLEFVRKNCKMLFESYYHYVAIAAESGVF